MSKKRRKDQINIAISIGWLLQSNHLWGSIFGTSSGCNQVTYVIYTFTIVRTCRAVMQVRAKRANNVPWLWPNSSSLVFLHPERCLHPQPSKPHAPQSPSPTQPNDSRYWKSSSLLVKKLNFQTIFASLKKNAIYISLTYYPSHAT